MSSIWEKNLGWFWGMRPEQLRGCGSTFTKMGKILDGASGKGKSWDSQEFCLGPEKSEMLMRWSCPAGHCTYKSEVQGIQAREIHFRISSMWTLCKAMGRMWLPGSPRPLLAPRSNAKTLLQVKFLFLAKINQNTHPSRPITNLNFSCSLS